VCRHYGAHAGALSSVPQQRLRQAEVAFVNLSLQRIGDFPFTKRTEAPLETSD